MELNGRRASKVYENDWAYFEPVHTPSCAAFNRSSKNSSFLLIIVKSSPYHFLKREAVRATWGLISNHSGFFIRTIFVMGRQADVAPAALEKLRRELRLHRDVLIGNYIDSYRNNTLKFLSAVQFSFDYCREQRTVPYALFVDDDYLVLMQNLVAEVKKHDVSLLAYPFDRYPPYISAGAVLLSSQAIREMYYAIQHTRLYAYDDVYAGILAKSLDLPVTHNKNMRFWKAALSENDASSVICAHGFEEEGLKNIYSELRRKIPGFA
ncbi:unnamed protein product [Gongylonema pulchrum]|uniref:Hexosyltransferase n=1 Tax=Gongylonema pulchrum TaxID=637853 RepID=A0A3P7NJF7_9BILA|nr:unnamed protein product [Gongylonema pulchrum]